MCSLTINAVADEILTGQNAKNKAMIEKRMVVLAGEASIKNPGALDNLGMTRMPEDLKDLKKKTVGRHRVYYLGHSTKCNYRIIYIKVFKKSGVEDDDDKAFQKMLAKVRAHPLSRAIELPQLETPDVDAPSQSTE